MLSIVAAIPRFVFRSLMLTGFLLFLLMPTVFLISRNRNRKTGEGATKADQAAVRLARSLAWLFGIKVEITGAPVSGAVLFTANHISWLDIPVVHSACAMGFVGKAEIEQWPIFSFIARAGGTIFHQRGSHDSATGVAHAMEQRLLEGRAVTIFPEGGIKPGVKEVRVFHARMYRPAVEVGCPVQPVMIRYMQNGQQDHDFSFRVGESMMRNIIRVLARKGVTAELCFLPPIEAAGKPRRELAEASRAAVINAYES
ncbi:MAG: 1-acyl-sn-glycerol-3-phosphate acyltransferase [Xanthomonadales bacterium]|nr:1-acyl-sn-glycerol-3-phosphate acyltransferase [Xanthomonadales bacterium]